MVKKADYGLEWGVVNHATTLWNVAHLKQPCSGLAAFFGGTLRLNTHSIVLKYHHLDHILNLLCSNHCTTSLLRLHNMMLYNDTCILWSVRASPCNTWYLGFAAIFLAFICYLLHISCFTHELENGTPKSGRPLIAKQVDSSNNLANQQ
jgi:hypothetical protein